MTPLGGRLLVVTAVPAEAAAVHAGCTDAVEVVAVGVGPAAAAAGTARLLALAEGAGTPYAGVVSAGIAGGFPGRAPVGGLVLGARSIAADLGAETADGFVPVDELGFGTCLVEADGVLLKTLTGALSRGPAGVLVGDIVTLSTVTGSAATAARLAARFPAAVAEAMEGYGVASAAAGAGVPFLELRAVSNLIGPRDRASWRIPDALAVLAAAAGALADLRL